MKKTRFNIVDLFALIVIVAIAGLAWWYFSSIDTGQDVNVIFVVEIRNMEADFAGKISEGDEVRDSIRNYFYGHVVSVEAIPMMNPTFNSEDLVFAQQRVPNRYDVRITIIGAGNETDSAISVYGNELRVGQEMFIRGLGFAGHGFLVGIRTE